MFKKSALGKGYKDLQDVQKVAHHTKVPTVSVQCAVRHV
jgi:hypothetical protein